MTTQTPEEIEKLKANWLQDPCWDIEDTEGFEDHRDELRAFHEEQDAKWEAKRKARKEVRAALVREQTGVIDADIVSSLYTWNEIERAVEDQTRFAGQVNIAFEGIVVELMQAQTRATLLQAAQLKRIADALENMDGDSSTLVSAKIWGS